MGITIHLPETKLTEGFYFILCDSFVRNYIAREIQPKTDIYVLTTTLLQATILPERKAIYLSIVDAAVQVNI